MTSSSNKPIEIVKGIYSHIQGRLYWISADHPPKNIAKAFYFNIDNVKIISKNRIFSMMHSIKISVL